MPPGPRRLLLACAFAVGAARGAWSQSRGVTLVFEATPRYLGALAAAVANSSDLVACGFHNAHCEAIPADVRQRVTAVVGQPRNVSAIGAEYMPSLKLVQSTSYMYPRLSDVPQQAMVASYQPDWRNVYGVEPIAEFVLAAAFHWNYQLASRAAEFTSCAWGTDAPSRCPPVSQLTSHPTLMGQTMGVLGYGKIGEAIARRSAALGMRTVATKVHGPFTPTPEPLAWLSDDNDRLLAESDFVAVSVPGSIMSVINSTALGLMKKTAVLIPISANPVDFDALRDALESHAIGGAIVDVWPQGCWHFPDMTCGPPYGAASEPYPTLPRTNTMLALPGLAMRDAKFWEGSAAWVASNLRALAEGRPLRGVVRPAPGLTKETRSGVSSAGGESRASTITV